MSPRNVCFLFGINGVGKSTLAQEIARQVPGCATVGASEALRAAFGGVSRADLERMQPELKHARLRDALLGLFHEHRAAPLIACDTHLVVSVRPSDNAAPRRERMWDNTYAPHGRAFVYVTADVADIAARRKRDAMETGRIRDARLDTVADDEAVNRAEFDALLANRNDAFIMRNSAPTTLVAANILRRMRGPRRH